MYITYKHRSTEYHVAACRNCEASMTMNDKQFQDQDHTLSSPDGHSCLHLFDTLGCCDSPIFYWAWEDETL